jgi:hypothetical protein
MSPSYPITDLGDMVVTEVTPIVSGPSGQPGPDNLVIVPAGTPLPTDAGELADLEGKLWVEYTP